MLRVYSDLLAKLTSVPRSVAIAVPLDLAKTLTDTPLHRFSMNIHTILSTFSRPPSPRDYFR